MNDFWSIFGPFLEPKLLQNRFRSGFGRALNEDSVSKLKKDRPRSSAGAAGHHKLDGIWALGRGNMEWGSIVLTHLTTLSKDKGSVDFFFHGAWK